MENNEDLTPENGNEPASSPKPGAGRMIREAREALGIPLAKVSADLRISPATLEALEAGDYGKLAGAPYVRAMLVSLSRHLRLDSREVLQAFAEETGSAQSSAAPVVSPYKDDSGTHARAHKQIFILILAVLLFVLLLIMGKVNTSSPDPEPAPVPAETDTLLKIDPLPDTLPADGASDTVDTVAAAVLPNSAEDDEPEVRETRVRILGLNDSVWLRVLPAGDREVSMYLRRNRPQEFVHADAITFITRQGGTVRVFLGDSSVVPDKRRFKVDGEQIDY